MGLANKTRILTYDIRRMIMFLSQIKKNKRLAFEHLVEIKKQNKETIVVNGNEYSYTTKRGLVKTYVEFNSFKEYQMSNLYPNKVERVNGFYFVYK